MCEIVYKYHIRVTSRPYDGGERWPLDASLHSPEIVKGGPGGLREPPWWMKTDTWGGDGGGRVLYRRTKRLSGGPWTAVR